MNTLARLFLAATLIMQVLATVSAHADDDDHDSVTGLKFVMRDMGQQSKVIVNALIKHEPVSPADLQAAADKLLADSKDAKGRLPDQLVDASGKPLPAKQADIQQFNTIMDQLIDATTRLDSAIHGGDLTTATTIFTGDIAAIKKQGHDIFNPQ